MSVDRFHVSSDGNSDEWPSDIKELFKHLDYLKDESDLGCILIGASFIEHCLERLIHASFTFNEPKLIKDMSRIFSNFYQKIKIAHAFGLVGPDEVVELDRFRKIRNNAAHNSAPSLFSDPEISKVISEMHANDIPGWDSQELKQRYIISVALVVQRLQRKAKLVKPMGYFPMDGVEGKSSSDDPMEATGSKVEDRKLIPGRMWWDLHKW